MIKIIVDTEEEKQQVLAASKHIHDSRDIDPDIPMVNTFMHLYQAPHLVEVKEKNSVER